MVVRRSPEELLIHGFNALQVWLPVGGSSPCRECSLMLSSSALLHDQMCNSPPTTPPPPQARLRMCLQRPRPLCAAPPLHPAAPVLHRAAAPVWGARSAGRGGLRLGPAGRQGAWQAPRRRGTGAGCIGACCCRHRCGTAVAQVYGAAGWGCRHELLAPSWTDPICAALLGLSRLQYGGLLMHELVAAGQEGAASEQAEPPPADEQASAGLAAGELRQALLGVHSMADVLGRVVSPRWGRAGALLCQLCRQAHPAPIQPLQQGRLNPTPQRTPLCLLPHACRACFTRCAHRCLTWLTPAPPRPATWPAPPCTTTATPVRAIWEA